MNLKYVECTNWSTFPVRKSLSNVAYCYDITSASMPFILKSFLLNSIISHVLEHSNETPCALAAVSFFNGKKKQPCPQCVMMQGALACVKLLLYDQNQHSYILCVTFLLMLM